MDEIWKEIPGAAEGVSKKKRSLRRALSKHTNHSIVGGCAFFMEMKDMDWQRKCEQLMLDGLTVNFYGVNGLDIDNPTFSGWICTIYKGEFELSNEKGDTLQEAFDAAVKRREYAETVEAEK